MKFQTFVKTAAFVGATAMATAALADGVPRRSLKDFSAPAPFSWTGFYMGLNAGIAWSDSDITLSGSQPGAPYVPAYFANIIGSGNGNVSDSAFTGGLQAGYNVQSGGIVWGIEGDINSFRNNTTRVVTNAAFPANPFTISDRVETDWLATLRARIGITLGATTLLYATGGLALTNLTHAHTYRDTTAPVFAEGASATSTKVGWAAGLGAEFALNRNWTVKGEWLYVDFGKVTSAGTLVNSASGAPVGASFSHSADLTAHIARVGINYKF